MAEVISYERRFLKSTVIIKVIDGKEMEFIDIDSLPVIERNKYFSEDAPSDASLGALILPFKRRSK